MEVAAQNLLLALAVPDTSGDAAPVSLQAIPASAGKKGLGNFAEDLAAALLGLVANGPTPVAPAPALLVPKPENGGPAMGSMASLYAAPPVQHVTLSPSLAIPEGSGEMLAAVAPWHFQGSAPSETISAPSPFDRVQQTAAPPELATPTATPAVVSGPVSPADAVPLPPGRVELEHAANPMAVAENATLAAGEEVATPSTIVIPRVAETADESRAAVAPVQNEAPVATASAASSEMVGRPHQEVKAASANRDTFSSELRTVQQNLKVEQQASDSGEVVAPREVVAGTDDQESRKDWSAPVLEESSAQSAWAAEKGMPTVLGPTKAPRPIQPHASPVDQVREVVLSHVAETRRAGRVDLHVRLEPPELGTVRLHLTASADGISGHVVVHEEAARTVLEQQLPELRVKLVEAGVNVGRLDVSRDNTGQSGAQSGPWHEAPRPVPMPGSGFRGGPQRASNTTVAGWTTGVIDVLA